MKKYCVSIILLITAVSAFPQGFDDMVSANPDLMTFFQQEMTSLMKFQAEHNINIPVFASATQRYGGAEYNIDYIYNTYAGYLDSFHNSNSFWFPRGNEHTDYYLFRKPENSVFDYNIFGGFQFKINNSFYIPIFVNMAFSITSDIVTNATIVTDDGTVMNVPFDANISGGGFFAGAGLFINTDILKGGIYMGYYFPGGASFELPFTYSEAAAIKTIDIYDKNYNLVYKDLKNDGFGTFTLQQTWTPFKIALVPLVNTSDWKYLGKVLSSILGYFGTGENTVYYTEKEGNSLISSFVDALNLGLNFTFNRIDLDPLRLSIETIYSRGAYDSAAKNDIYGIKVLGLFPGYPFGFSLEGGYKHFHSISPFFSSYYNDTGYFNGSIFFPFKYFTLSALYQYDGMRQNRFGFSLSTNFLAGHFLYGQYDAGDRYADKAIAGDTGARFRWGGWKAGKE